MMTIWLWAEYGCIWTRAANGSLRCYHGEAAEVMRLVLARATAARAHQRGCAECTDCGEPITPLRQSLGAVLRIDCQQHAEVQASRMGARR